MPAHSLKVEDDLQLSGPPDETGLHEPDLCAAGSVQCSDRANAIRELTDSWDQLLHGMGEKLRHIRTGENTAPYDPSARPSPSAACRS